MAKTSDIEQIIERQMRLWKVRGRLAGEGGEPVREALAHLGEGPWITVSRQFGSGGVELARRLGQATGWQVFDGEICAEIVRHTKTREAVLSRLDEHAIGGFSDYLAQMLVPGAIGRIAYLKEMMHVIWGLARHGHAVIQGRGANWFLPASHGLRLRVIAPIEQRAVRFAETRGIGLDDAVLRLKQGDEDQVAFIRQVFDRDVNDPAGYDLVINLGDLSIVAAETVALAALREKLGI